MSEPRVVLETQGVSKHFGGVAAVDDVSIRVEEGTICGLVGPNGSGKTTLLGCLSRMLDVTRGRLLVDGQDFTNAPRHRLRHKGMARTFQGIRLVKGLSVRENVLVGVDTGVGLFGRSPWAAGRRSESAKRDEVDRLLADMELLEVADGSVDALPYGVQRRVEIARALATRPRLLLLDEPVAGMNDAEVLEIKDLLLRLKDEGMTIVLVEHHLDMILSASDHLVVLDFGSCIAAGDPQEVATRPEVRQAYFGKEHDVPARR